MNRLSKDKLKRICVYERFITLFHKTGTARVNLFMKNNQSIVSIEDFVAASHNLEGVSIVNISKSKVII